MTSEQNEVIYAAYLGISILRTMCKKAGLTMAEQRSKELMIELDMAFPGLAGRAALREIPPLTPYGEWCRNPTACAGTPDWWDYQPIAQLLRVMDFKYGHLFVDVFECWQLIAYVLGIVDFLELPEDTWVEMGIVQPRSYHAEGPVRYWGGVGKLRVSDLRKYTETARNAAFRALEYPDPEAAVGSHCLLCPARHECRTLELAATAVCDFVGTIERVDLPAPALAAELAILRDAAVLLKARVTGLEEQAMARIRRGERLQGFGIDHVKSRAVWNKPMGEVYEMGDLMGVDLRDEPTAITPAQAIKKGIDAEIIEGYSFRPPGAAKLITDSTTTARKVFGANAT